MAIEVVNPDVSEPGLSYSELKENVLYKQKDSPLSTIYLKTASERLIWFEKGRIGDRRANPWDRFIPAPKGTEVHLTA